jgi:hypothetical protein
MTRDRRSIRGRGVTMHPLFAKLYLSGDTFDADGSEQDRRSRLRRRTPRQRIIRRR